MHISHICCMFFSIWYCILFFHIILHILHMQHISIFLYWHILHIHTRCMFDILYCIVLWIFYGIFIVILCIFCIFCIMWIFVHDDTCFKSLSFIVWISKRTKMTGQQKLVIMIKSSNYDAMQTFICSYCMCLQRGLNPQQRKPVSLPTQLQIH